MGTWPAQTPAVLRFVFLTGGEREEGDVARASLYVKSPCATVWSLPFYLWSLSIRFLWSFPGCGNSSHSLPMVRDVKSLAPTVPGCSPMLGVSLCHTLVTVSYIHCAVCFLLGPWVLEWGCLGSGTRLEESGQADAGCVRGILGRLLVCFLHIVRLIGRFSM